MKTLTVEPPPSQDYATLYDSPNCGPSGCVTTLDPFTLPVLGDVHPTIVVLLAVLILWASLSLVVFLASKIARKIARHTDRAIDEIAAEMNALTAGNDTKPSPRTVAAALAAATALTVTVHAVARYRTWARTDATEATARADHAADLDNARRELRAGREGTLPVINDTLTKGTP